MRCKVKVPEKSKTKMLQRARPLLQRLPVGPCRMVEIGVDTGIMSEYLLTEHRGLEWIGVDPWYGAEVQPDAYVKTGDVHATLSAAQADERAKMARQRLARFGQRARIYREESVGVSRRWVDEQIDLVFLDGDHSRIAVAADIDAWWPLIKPGGWLGGHDYANPDPRFRFGVQTAVDDWSREWRMQIELDSGTTWWCRKRS